MKTQVKIMLLSILGATTLMGCETIPSYETRTMSCYEIAQEIGKVEARQDKAKDGKIGAVVDAVFGEKNAEYDYEANEIMADEAKDTLRYLKSRYNQQGCRR